MRVVGFEPCFSVVDVQRAVSHYEQLGFSSSYHDESYAFAHRDNLTIHLAHGEQPTAGPGALYIHVDDADRLAEEWRGAGVEVVGPVDQDYGKREGSHVDPDGNLLRFGSPLHRRGAYLVGQPVRSGTNFSSSLFVLSMMSPPLASTSCGASCQRAAFGNAR